jgi:hypothetical protein
MSFLPKRGQIWTTRERTRFLAVGWGIPLLAGLIFGIFTGHTMVIVAGVLGVICTIGYVITNERKLRDEP